MNEQSGYLTVDGRPLYCTLFLPERGVACWGVAVAEPFGEEKRCAARMFTRMARKLAQRQIATIKFDFSATGDSAGESSQAQWTHWQQELEAAMKMLQQESKAPKMALLGARAGALLAAQCSAQNAVQALLLAEPFLSGEEILAELEKRQKIKDAILERPSLPAATELWALGQSVDFAGFQVNPQFAAQISKINLLEVLQKCPATCRVLLLKISGARKFPPAWETLLKLLEPQTDSGALLIKDKPFWGQLEYYESDAVIDPIMDFLTAENS